MANIYGNAALKAAQDNSMTMEERQIEFIVKCFMNATALTANDFRCAPMLMHVTNVRTSTGYAEVIEIHGFYTADVAEKAIFAIKDRGFLKHLATLEETVVTEMVKDKSGAVTAIKFIKPTLRKLTPVNN